MEMHSVFRRLQTGSRREEWDVELDCQGWNPRSTAALSAWATHLASLSSDSSIYIVTVIIPGWLVVDPISIFFKH